MESADSSRLSRLTAILTQLQTRRLVTATQLAEKYGVSIRTIYRDIRSLEQAGVPISTQEGKGYTLMEHYRLPPVMLTETEANAMILAEQLVLKTTDASFINAYSDALDKIKAVLRHQDRDKANLLHERTSFAQNTEQPRTSDNLSSLQFALTNFLLVDIVYTNKQGKVSERTIEPFALLSTENWLLIAWCRLRKEFRFFRLDRIRRLQVRTENFSPHGMTLQEYFDRYY